MLQQRPDTNGYYSAARHFNVRCAGNILFSRVTKRDLKELREEIIESVWAVEERRELTKTEIKKLCAGAIK